MAESSLAVAYQELLAEVALNLGWGRGPDYKDPEWTQQQKNSLESCLRSGLRQFYFPPPMEGELASYDWSFLRPVTTITFPLGAQSIPLPEDFGGLEGRITLVTTASNIMPWRIEWRNEGMIREMYGRTPTMTGPPMFAAERPVKGTTATSGQRKELLIFPLADQSYTLQFQYYINPDYLTGAFPYAYGGAQHAETLLESCLAIAEQRLDDASSVHTMKFQERLAASISMDRRNKPQNLGRNVDRSDDMGLDRNNRHWFEPACTYNNQSFN